MTEPTLADPTPAPSRSLSPKTWTIISAVVVLAVVIVAVLTATFTMAGTVRSSCYSYSSGVRVGAPVTVFNEDGKVVATSSIEHIGGFGSDCTYGFRADNVPAFHSRYGVQVGTYNTVYFDRAEANFPQLVTY